ncbi:Antitoxin component YwqK of the YwqJK toxin-antitoxin module [Parelusimicrobium proximum]|uniref:toxin-antitoxin system YwqK family antitoxin n=1 Tax=Parelusimicrobium proximum TaxID=3228953 RepID=UPI003D16E1AE
MEEKIISIASSKLKKYYRCVLVAEEVIGDNTSVLETKGSIPDGEVTEYYTALKCIKSYKKGLLDGELKMVNIEDGKITLTETYEDGDLKKIVDTATLAPLAVKDINNEGAPVYTGRKEGVYMEKKGEYITFFIESEEIGKLKLDPKGEVIEVSGNIPTGVVREYDDNNSIKTEATFANSKLNGLMKRYDEDRRIISEEEYKDGKLEGEARYYDYSTGKQEVEIESYKNGILEGKRLLLHPNGNIEISEFYADNKLKGKREIFYDNGILNLEETYDNNGRLTGTRVYYHKSGGVWFKESYAGGVLTGERTCYFPSGEVQMKETYKEGLLEGEKVIFDKDGTTLFKEEYEWGSPVNKRKR